MYQQTIPYVQVETYPDLWRKGRYRVDLTAELYLEIDSVDAALEQLDYHIIDSDQQGQSYIHNQDRSRTAELDEAGEEPAYVKLVLRNADLDEEGINAAEDYLNTLFDRIYQMCP
jgi:hypothetical protein